MKTDSTGSTSYTWDFENRLSSVTMPGSGGTISFKYDPFGRRIYKSSSSGTSVFAYDGNDLIEETNASGGVVARYTQGPEVDEPLAMLRSSTTSFYNADGLGSISSLSNGAGSLAQTYGYDSFGKQTSSSGSLTNPFQYTARELDSETNLYFYRARYYDQNAGRFLSEDPLRFRVKDPLGVRVPADFYVYALNEPILWRDPDGRDVDWVGVYRSFKKAKKKAAWLNCFVRLGFCVNGLQEDRKTVADGLTDDQRINIQTSDQNIAKPNNMMSNQNLSQCLRGDENCAKAIEDCLKAVKVTPF